MNVGRMAKDAHRVFRAHPEWRYGVNRYHPKKRHLREAIRSCIAGVQEPGVVSSTTGRFLADRDDEGFITVYLEIGSDYRGV